MKEPYERALHPVYKALERPASYFGLPMQLFFIVCAVPFLLGCYVSILFWLVIPVVVFLLGLLSRKDPHIYTLLYLKLKTLGNIKANSFYGATAIFSQDYEPVPLFLLGRSSFKDHEAE